MLNITLDPTILEPLYRQLIRKIRQQISEGILRPGQRLPTTRELSLQLSISRVSVVNAYAELQAGGLLEAHPGRGTFVAMPRNGVDSRTLPSAAATPGMAQILARQGELIAFSGGAPAEEFLPTAALHQALNAVLERDGAMALTYEDTEGYLPLRQLVAQSNAALGIRCAAHDVLITGGCQQALDLAIQALLVEGDTLLTSTPTFLGLLDLARIRRVRVHGVEMDADGIRLDALEKAIATHKPKLLYLAPTHHNPTGTVMPLRRRRALLRIAHEAQLMILEDNVYHELYYGVEPPPPLKALDEHGLVLYANGYSKVILPGTRIGYLIADGPLRERALQVKQAADICTPGLNQRAMHYFLQSGAQVGHLDRVRRACRERRDMALAAAEQHMPAGAVWTLPYGGMYLWIRLPMDGPTASTLYDEALKHGVNFAIGGTFYIEETAESAYHLRLNFAAQPPQRIEEGLRRIGQAWQTLANAKGF
jgi:GntR family transcriptional regulator / MocR family aminotransferase